MSQAVYTYGDVYIAPYHFEKLLDFTLTKALNDHAKLTIRGIVPEDKLDQYVERADDQEIIKVVVPGRDREIVLFQGVVTKLAVQAVQHVRTLTIEAHSFTFWMDIQKKSRSFQNKQMTYKNLFTRITEGYPGSDVVDEASEGRSIGSLLVQYQETDWEFAKRLASHFHAPLVPTCTLNGVKYFVGLPYLGEPQQLDVYNYTIKKDLKEYQWKSANDKQNLSEQNTLHYEVTSSKILDLCSPVHFQQRTLYVFQAGNW